MARGDLEWTPWLQEATVKAHKVDAAESDEAFKDWLVDALKEISAQEGSLECFTDRQKGMLAAVPENQDRANEETLANQKKNLDHLIELVKTFYVDWHKFFGRGLKKTYAQDIEELLSRLDTTVEELIMYITID